MGYTLAQFTAFVEADIRRERERARIHLSLMAVACQGDKKSVERLEKELGRED